MYVWDTRCLPFIAGAGLVIQPDDVGTHGLRRKYLINLTCRFKDTVSSRTHGQRRFDILRTLETRIPSVFWSI